MTVKYEYPYELVRARSPGVISGFTVQGSGFRVKKTAEEHGDVAEKASKKQCFFRNVPMFPSCLFYHTNVT